MELFSENDPDEKWNEFETNKKWLVKYWNEVKLAAARSKHGWRRKYRLHKNRDDNAYRNTYKEIKTNIQEYKAKCHRDDVQK